MPYKIGQHAKKYKFVPAKNQAELKDLIAQSQKIKQMAETQRISNEMKEATTDAEEAKKKKKEHEKEVRLARNYLNTDVLDTSGTNLKLYDELVKLSETHPKQFQELMNTNLLSGMKKKLETILEARAEEEVADADIPGLGTDVTNDATKKYGEKLFDEIVRSRMKTKDHYKALANIPALEKIIEAKILASPTATGRAISQQIKHQYGLPTGFDLKKETLDKFKQELDRKRGLQADAAREAERALLARTGQRALAQEAVVRNQERVDRDAIRVDRQRDQDEFNDIQISRRRAEEEADRAIQNEQQLLRELQDAERRLEEANRERPRDRNGAILGNPHPGGRSLTPAERNIVNKTRIYNERQDQVREVQRRLDDHRIHIDDSRQRAMQWQRRQDMKFDVMRHKMDTNPLYTQSLPLPLNFMRLAPAPPLPATPLPAHPRPPRTPQLIPVNEPIATRTRSNGRPAGTGLNISSKKIIKDLTTRMHTLVGEIKAGNHSNKIKEELYDILDFLLKHRVISRPVHKRIVKAVKLNDL